jgi:hypothetical protein
LYALASIRCVWLLAGLLLAGQLGAIFTLRAQSHGGAYYVAPTGSDDNPGTLAAPFKTIQRCAQIVVAGETCVIRGGVYRETVRPAHSGRAGSPITFTAYPGERVTISGADVVEGWSRHAGSVYKTTLLWTMADPAQSYPHSNDQIFVDGAMMTEARWPNISVGRQVVLRRNDNAISEGGVQLSDRAARYSSSRLAAFGENVWRGAKINFTPGYDMIATTCDVTSNSGNTVILGCPANTFGEPASSLAPSKGDAFYLWDTLAALDSGGEWYRAADGTLYLQTPDGGDPSRQLVEAKRRTWAVVLDARQHINVVGLDIFAAALSTDANTKYVLFDTIDARYIWHFSNFNSPDPYDHDGFYAMTGKGGIVLAGEHNTLQNSMIAYSAANAVVLSGASNTVSNTVAYGIGYMAGNDAISGSATSSQGKHLITRSTIFDTGRVPIAAGSAVDITYNDLYNSHLQAIDLGVIYSWGTDGKDANIAYNLVHDAHAPYDSNLRHWGGHGIYLDDDTYNFNVFRNIVWNTTSPGIFAMGNNGMFVQPNVPVTQPANRKIYNNTVDGRIGVRAKTQLVPAQTMRGTEFRNNIARGSSLRDSQVVSSTNIIGDAAFVDPLNHDYRLRSGSAAINAGQLLPPITDGYNGPAPDIGALEWGQPMLQAGAVLRHEDLADLAVECVPQPSGGTARCTITHTPLGRTFPASFELRVGAGAIKRNCAVEANYTTHQAAAVCDGVALEGPSAGQEIVVRVDGGTWVAVGRIDARQPRIERLEPMQGTTQGGTPLTIKGVDFDTNATRYQLPISIQNPAGVLITRYQLLVTLDTATLIAADKMRPDCGDLRFRDQFGGLSYWLETGCNSANTRIWVNAINIPAVGGTIWATYGDHSLPSASNGAATFLFFDDFEDGQVDSNWTTDAMTNVTVREVDGQMQIAGLLAEADKYRLSSFALNPYYVSFPPAFAIDSTWAILTQSLDLGPRAILGSDDSVLVWFSAAPRDQVVGYWKNGQLTRAGDSALDAPTFSAQHISVGYAANDVVYYFENDQLRASRGGLVQPRKGTFSYAPNVAQPFDVRFDNVRIRNFMYPQPTVSIGAETLVSQGPRVLLGDTPCVGLVAVDATTLTCITPPRAPGPVDVVVLNPDGAEARLTQGYTYLAPVPDGGNGGDGNTGGDGHGADTQRQRFLPLVRVGS